jgi:hypothetical protein
MKVTDLVNLVTTLLQNAWYSQTTIKFRGLGRSHHTQ